MIQPRSVEEYLYAFSVTDGVVREVYEINEWYKTDDRYAFNGKLAPTEIIKRAINHQFYIEKTCN